MHFVKNIDSCSFTQILQVPYATALDNFIILCFVAVFAALVEFACINFIDTFVKNAKQRIENEKAKEEEKIQSDKRKVEEAVLSLSEYGAPAIHLQYDKNTLLVPIIEVTEEKLAPKDYLLSFPVASNVPERDFPTLASSEEDEFDDIDEFEQNEELGESKAETELRNKPGVVTSFVVFFNNIPQKCTNFIFRRIELAIEKHWGPLQERNFFNNTTEVIWQIDSYARHMFPLIFLILQFIYWSSYLYIL